MHRPRLDLTPPHQVKALQGLWLLWAIFACCLLTISAWGFANQVAVLPAGIVNGSFEAQTPSVDVVVPAGLVVSDVLVTDGETVEKGQKLALFDQAALHRHIHEIQQDISVREFAQACWSSPYERAPTAKIDSASSPAALETCRLTKQTEKLAQEQLIQRRQSLKRETALAVRELVLRAESTPSEVRNILYLRAALERETLNSVVRDVEFELAQLLTKQRDGHLQQHTRLETEINVLKTRLDALEANALKPWLEAPEEGLLARLRLAPRKSARDLNVTVAQIQRKQDKAYQARFVLSPAEVQRLQETQTMQVRLAGLPRSDNRIPAHIHAIRPLSGAGDPRSEVIVHLSPDPHAKTVLLSLPDGTRSAMQVALPPQHFGRLLQAASSRLLQSF